MDEVKAPQHDGTPRSHAHARIQKMPHVVEVVEADQIRAQSTSQQRLARRKHAVVLGRRERAVAKKPDRRVGKPSSNHRRQEHQLVVVYQYDIAFLVLERDGFQVFLVGLHEGLVQVRPPGHICR